MSRTILTAEEMRAAEARAIAAGTPVETLMERAGMAAARAIRLFAGESEALILCGLGNNGGDGYVIARALRERGMEVRVAALDQPRSAAAGAALQAWGGAVQTLMEASPAPLLVDALFGTGLTRGLDEDVAGALGRLAAAARIRVAVDLPSGVSADDGRILSPVPDFDLTVTFATLKPSHLLQPSARHMGRIVVADIGVEAESWLHEIGRPSLRKPGPKDHKYSRGYVAVVAGEMPGASALAAAAAARAGAGYVRLASEERVAGIPHSVVQSSGGTELLQDDRIGAVVIGPGLGRSIAASALFERACACGRPLIIDADALFLLDFAALRQLQHVPILTPHEGEFQRLFGRRDGSKVEIARTGAAECGAVIVYKGADTVVAAPDGRAGIAPPAPACLASAGTGDVLAGVIAAMRASGLDAFEAACAGVWLHGRAAEHARPGLIADDLIAALPAALSGR
jgi:hydroxyethylthiazole kinase-like uncharacterized protein yjeF